jgi:hypothetical protein
MRKFDAMKVINLKLSVLVKTNIQFKGERNIFQKPKSLQHGLIGS